MFQRPSIEPILTEKEGRSEVDMAPAIECRTPKEAPSPSSAATPSPRWHWVHTQLTKKVLYVVLFCLSTFLSSSIACGWVANAVHRSTSTPFSLARAIAVLHAHETAYDDCIQDALAHEMLALVTTWSHEQDVVASIAVADEVAIVALANATLACKATLAELQTTLLVSSSSTVLCSPDDQLALETLQNAYSLSQPPTTSRIFLRFPNAQAQADATALNRTLTAYQDAVHADAQALRDVVSTGASSLQANADAAHAAVLTLQSQWSTATSDTADIHGVLSSLQGVKASAAAIEAVLAKAKPALAAVGITLPPLRIALDLETSMTQLLLFGAVMNRSIAAVANAQEATQADARAFVAGLGNAMDRVDGTSAALASQVARYTSPNASTLHRATFSNWTLRDALLEQRGGTVVDTYPEWNASSTVVPTTMATDADAPDNDPQGAYGVDVQGNVVATSLPLDLLVRLALCVLVTVMIAQDAFTDIPEIDNQNTSRLQTTADWLNVLRCRHSIMDVLSSVCRLRLWPFFVAVLLGIVLTAMTVLIVIPLNRMHSEACGLATMSDPSPNWLGNIVVSFASSSMTANGALHASAGVSTLQSLHDNSCAASQLSIVRANMGHQANTSLRYREYAQLHALVTQLRKCLPPNDTSADCAVSPEAIAALTSLQTYTCPAYNATRRRVQGACAAVVRRFASGDGKAHVCALERSLLEMISVAWVSVVTFVLLNGAHLCFMKAVAFWLWRALSAGRYPFVGFVDADGNALDADQLRVRLERRLAEHSRLCVLYAGLAAALWLVAFLFAQYILASLAEDS
ncbi:hypothetical protein SDRG_09793 [Saprolegnia diclina VS20]|uniref:Uncharacterized protein n=1 Tax=Saprolegnia diclina (strain VS20) TaxID=1156394 RepID=T0QCR5_SAPDV|nr:hypothetical protein SDRG_09793 [Saprolegnia diclina VS20]EQC32466.1 hypothetical protein SDRG_09793 [Saprolegnia diclina VS20]|eukprot:XP_008613967.1 hypothetical protein SDRG_09793 [Saprolegnia diclina VS20]